MTLQAYYYNLGSGHIKQASLAKTLLGTAALGGLAGSLYGMSTKYNPTRDPLHPSTAGYGSVGLHSGLGLGAGLLASRALGAKGLLARLGIPLAAAGLGAFIGTEKEMEDNNMDFRLKQPGIDYSFDPKTTNLKYLSREAAKL